MLPRSGNGMRWNRKAEVGFLPCLVTLCAMLFFVTSPAQAAQVTATWVGGTGNWNTASNWSPAVVPNNNIPAGTTYSVIIDGGAAGVSNVSLNTNATIDVLTVSSGDTLGINNGQSLVIATASTLSNAGTIAINSSGSSTYLYLGGDVSLTGGGTVVMSNSGFNRIQGLSTGIERLTNVNNTISGAGQIGVNFMKLTNQSTIVANASAGLTVDVNGTGSVNSGTLRADGGNGLHFNSGAIDNTGGTIRANASTVVMNNSAVITAGTVDVVGAGELRLASGASVTGGTLTNSTSGIIRSQGSTNTIGGTVSNPAGGQIILDNGTGLLLTSGAGNTYSNAGSMAINSSGSSTYLYLGGDVSLTGGGTLTMSNSGFNRIQGISTGNERLTNVNNTISGAGQIGVNFMKLTNQSTIVANASAGLVIDVNGTGNVNSGTLRADGGNGLHFNSGAIDNTGGTIRANASTVIMNGGAAITAGTVDVVGVGELRLASGASVTGGLLTNSATGIIRSQGSTNTIGGTVSNPAGGQIILDNGTALLLSSGAGNTYSNAGTIAMNSSGSSTFLFLNGDVSLTGGGTLTMSNSGFNRIQGISTGNERLTNVNNTISGAGQIGVNFMKLTNQSTIIANSSAGLVIDPNGTGNVNSGTLRADGGNGLYFNSGAIDNTGGTIRANASLVVMNGGAAITAGTVDVVGAGELRLNSGASVTGGTLTNSATGIIRSQGGGNTIGGTVSNPAGGQIILDNGTALLLSSGAGNTYSNAGTIAMNSSGSSTFLFLNGDLSLTGGGTVVMSNSLFNRIQGQNTGAERLINVNNTISGAGQIGVNFMRLTNQGTIRADQTTNLNIDITPAASGFTTSGTVQVNAGSTLVMGSGDVFTQTAGNTVVNGTLTLTGGTTLQLQGGTLKGSGTVGGPVNNTGGTAAPGNSPGILSESGSYTQASGGALGIEIGSATVGTGYDQLNVTGAVNLNGALNVSLINSFIPTGETLFTIINNDSTDVVTGTFTGKPEGAIFVSGASAFSISYVGGDGNDVVLKSRPLITINDVTLAEGNSGTTNFVFTVSLSAPSTQAVTVQFATANGTATAGSDYTALALTTLTIPAGQSSGTVTVAVSGDPNFEPNETFFVNLTSPANATIADAQGLGTINNDDAQPSISINDLTIAEGNSGTTNFGFTVSLSAFSSQAVTVQFATANGTATAGSDYTALSLTTLTIPAGQSSGTVTVAVSGDPNFEPNETFLVNLSNATNATIADSQGQGTINNDDPLPSISINNVTIAEGNSGTTNFGFTVSLSAFSTQAVTVQFATANGTATAGSDYTALALTTLTIPVGQSSGTVTVAVNGDNSFEPNETFFVNLTSPVNATIADAQGLGTITNDDAQPSISINDVTIAEGNSGTTNFGFTVSLSAPSTQAVTVQFATANGTATAGSDYTALPLTTLTIPAGQSSGTVTVAVSGDPNFEPNETFFVNLTSPVNATIADAQGLGTITNDDAPPAISINDVTLTEGNSGTTNFGFTVSLSAPSTQTATVQFITANGTATAGSDYVAAALTTLTFAPGETTKTLSIVVNGDTLNEANETFFVNLSNAVNATIADNQGQGTIANDDVSVAVNNPRSLPEGNVNASGSVTFDITLNFPSTQTVTVNYQTANGINNPALAGTDYTAKSGKITFLPGQTLKKVTISFIGDNAVELNETFFFDLLTPVNTTIADSRGVGQINNDDGPGISISNAVTIDEGDSGTSSQIFTVTLSAASTDTITVDWTTANNTATANDFVAASGTLTFALGETSKTITVQVNGDTTIEPNETYKVNLSKVAYAFIADGTGLGTIRNDDAAAQTFENDEPSE